MIISPNIIHFLSSMLLPLLDAAGITFFGCPSMPPSVYLKVLDHIL